MIVETPIETLRHSLRVIAENQGAYQKGAKFWANMNLERYWRDEHRTNETPDPYTILHNINEPELIAHYEAIK